MAKKGGSVKIRDAHGSDIDEIVKIHIKSFEGFFLTSMGPSFLRPLYKAFIEKQTGLMRVACDESNQVVGFSAGTTSPDSFFLELKIAKGFQFCLAAIPGLLKNPTLVMKKIFGALFYKGDRTEKLENSALLSSLAVMPTMSGKSIGRQLVLDFQQQVIKSSSCKRVYLITDKLGNEKVIYFYQKLNYVTESEFTQSGNREMICLVKSL
jgi:ribosomal protein S18 acetylase RimI-like enzyme